MSVQRSMGSNVAAWITRVPPAIGSSRHHHSLSNPDPVTRRRKTDSGRASEALDAGPFAQQAEPRPCQRVAAAAGHDGTAGPSRNSGNSEDEAAGSWSAAHTTRGGAWTNPSFDHPLAAGDHRHVDSRPRGQGGRPSSSDADRVPDRLHLEEGGDPFGAFGGAVVQPVEAGIGDPARAARQALDVVGGQLLGLDAKVVGHTLTSRPSTST